MCGVSELDWCGIDCMCGYLSGIKVFVFGELCVICLGELFIIMSYGGFVMVVLLEVWLDIDVVMCVSDMFVFGVIMECYCCGLFVFGDIVVVGFGNFEVVWCCYLIIMMIFVDVYGIGLCMGGVLFDVLGVGEVMVMCKFLCIDFSVVECESV